MDRNIKDAKDIGTGELIYFNSHAKATYTNDGSILEDIISSFKQDGYPVIEHGTEDTTFTLTPNALHVWGKVSTLTLTLGEETEGITNEFIFIFEGSSNPVLTLPDTIKWADDVLPSIVPGKIYCISILNNLAVFSVFEGTDAQVGDICLSNANGDKKFIKVGDVIPDGWTPIGVVVIPESHDVYGTGECAVMSLKYMNYTTPNEGSISYQGMYWGGDNTDTSLYNYTYAATIGSATAQTETVSFTGYPYLPSDAFTATTCTKDTNASYSSSERTAAPSPYLTDGSRNSQYYTNGNNALSDFDGVGNTNILTGLATGEDWKTATSITNNSGSTYYPAACCCWRYSTVGTVQGNWYLPACGELGYLCARFKTINNAIQYLIDLGFSDSCSLVASSYFWSSSEYSSDSARCVLMYYGNVYGNLKYDRYYVRAFLRVK